MASLIAAIEGWLTRQRALILARLLVPVMLAAEAVNIWSDPALRWKLPYGHDFVSFWVAARLTAEGAHRVIYDPAAFLALQDALAVRPGFLMWHYPPTYLLLLWPLSLIGFSLAWAAFSVGGVTALGLAARRLTDRRDLALLLGAPVIGVTLIQGQNGAWFAAAMLGGLWAREAGRPWLAAGLFALLSAKPHLGVLLPVALIAARDWRLFWRTGVMVLGFAALSLLALGAEPWLLFWQNRTSLGIALSDPEVLAQMPTAFAMAILAGAALPVAAVLQGLSVLLAVAAVWRVWRDPRAVAALRAAVLMMAVLMISPYGFRYDMVFSLCATLILMQQASRDGWLPGERLALATLWALPAIFPAIALVSPVQLGFPLQLLGLWSVWRRYGLAASRADGG